MTEKLTAKELNRQVLDAVVALLEAKGWNVVVIGDTRVEQRDPTRQFNFEFVVGFTGSKPKEQEGASDE